jgi:hypothetical protein
MDRAVGTASSTGGNGKLGGALADPFTAAPVLGNRIYVKAGTYSTSVGFSSALAQSPANNAPPCRLIGYSTSRGDNGRATVQASGGSVVLVSITGAGWVIENFVLDCNSQTTATGLSSASSFTVVRNCVVKNFTNRGIQFSGGTDSMVEDCEVTGGTSAASSAVNLGNTVNWVIRCWIHDNACPGILAVSSCMMQWNLITNNTGASSDGIQCQYGCQIFNNTIHGNGRHGINKTDIFYALYWRNNILTSNGGFGAVGASGAGIPADPSFDGNAYWNNTSGARSNMDDTSTNAIDAVSPYTNTFDKTLTGDPYTNAAGNDFSLNTTGGAGAACRAGGTPGTWVNGTPTGYLDMGAVQHQDPGAALVFARGRVRFSTPFSQKRSQRFGFATFSVTNTNTLPIRRRVPFPVPFPLHPHIAPIFQTVPYMVRVPRLRPFLWNYPRPRRIAAQVSSITLNTVGLPTTRAKRFPVPAFQRPRPLVVSIPQAPIPLPIRKRHPYTVTFPSRVKKTLLTTFSVTNTLQISAARPRRYPVAAFQHPRPRTLVLTPAPTVLAKRVRSGYLVVQPRAVKRTLLTTAQITNTVALPFGRPRRFPFSAYQRARSLPQPIPLPLVIPQRSRRLVVQTYPRRKPLAFIALVTPLPCLRIKRNIVPALYRQKPQIITAYPPIVPLSVVRRRVAPGPAQIVRKTALGLTPFLTPFTVVRRRVAPGPAQYVRKVCTGLAPSLTPPYVAVQVKRRVPFSQVSTVRRPAVAGHGCLVFGGLFLVNSTRRPRVYTSYQPGRRQPARSLFQSVTTQQSTLIKSVRTIR